MSASPRSASPEVLARIARLGLRANQAVQGSLTGMHKSPHFGQSVEFADFREYAPGDDLRRLDWRVYARTGRHVVKLYEEETNLRASFLLDASASMRYGNAADALGAAGDPKLSKLDYASITISALASLLVRQRDAAGLVVFDEGPREWLRPSTSRVQLAHMIERLAATEATRETDLHLVLRQAAEELPSRGVVVIVSDLFCDQEELFAGLGRLRHRGHELIVVQVLDRDELDLPFEGLVEFRGLEGGERLEVEPRSFRVAYRDAVERFCQDAAARAADLGADYLRLVTDEDPGAALSFWLHRRSRLLGRASGRGGRAGRAAALRAGGGGA